MTSRTTQSYQELKISKTRKENELLITCIEAQQNQKTKHIIHRTLCLDLHKQM